MPGRWVLTNLGRGWPAGSRTDFRQKAWAPFVPSLIADICQRSTRKRVVGMETVK